MLEIELSNCQKIYNLNNEQKEKIRKDLTFKNPAYENILKYSKWGKTREPEFLHYYKETSDYMEVPIGYSRKSFVPYEITKDVRLDLNVKYPKPLITLRDLQEKATLSYMKEVVGTLGSTGTIILPTGSGKAEPLDTKILTPNGYKLMGDIKVGDEVIGEDGNFYSVSGVYPQGIKDVYELTFKDGTKTRCCKEHLWKYASANMLHYKRGNYKVAELQEIMKEGLKRGRKYNFNIPINKPINYSDKEVLIPPYVLGLLLGDGCLNTINGGQCRVYFSNTEADIIDNLNSMMGDLGNFTYNKSSQCQYVFKNPIEGIKHSKFIQEIKRLKLNVLGQDKFIPNEYKFNSVAKRMELLKGLFDTDGSVGKNGSYRFSSSSISLIKDVEFLCRSLGYRTTLKVYDRTGQVRVANGKEYKIKNPEYTLTIMTNDIIFKSKKHLERKKEADKQHRPAQKHKYDVLPVVDIQYVGKEECQCIMVDSKDHTYLCDDFIVTHNTIVGVYLSYLMKQRTLIVVNKDDLVDGWTQDIKLCFGEDVEVGLVKGKVFKIGEQFTLTTIQTLSRLGKEKLDKLYENISMIICDETHKVAAKSYQVLLGFPAKYRLGLTATKMRNDGLVDVIDLLCGETVFDGTKELTEDIIPAHRISIIKRESSLRWQPRKSYYNILTKQNVHNIKNGDLELYEGTKEWRDYCNKLEAQGLIQSYPLRLHEAYSLIAEDEAFNLQVATDIKKEYDNGKSCVVFCKTVEQLKKLYEILLPSCPKIQLFYGGSANKTEVKEKAESKEVLITLATVSIACEGTNVKSWERGFLVSSVANEKDLIQILGRLRRTKQGKESVIFYDYTFPNMAGMRNHWFKRKNWYKDLGCNICE